MKKIVWILLLLIAVACGNRYTLKPDEARISGVLQNAKNKTITLVELTPNGEIIVDSAVLEDNGKFSFKFKVPYAGLFLLRTDQVQNFITILPDSLEEIVVLGDYTNLPKTFDVKGSVLTDSIKGLQHLVYENKMYLDSLSRYWDLHKYDDYAEQIKSVLDQDYENQRQRQKEYQTVLINNNRTSIVPVFVLFQRFGSKPVFLEQDDADFDFMRKTVGDMHLAMPDNPHVVALFVRYDHIKNLKRQQELEQQQQPAS